MKTKLPYDGGSQIIAYRKLLHNGTIISSIMKDVGCLFLI